MTPNSLVLVFLSEYHMMMLFLMWNIMVFQGSVLCLFVFGKESGINTDPWKPESVVLEIFWSIYPGYWLVLLGFSSLLNLYKMELIDDYKVLFKAIGNQWYWSYEYSMGGAMNELMVLSESSGIWDVLVGSEECFLAVGKVSVENLEGCLHWKEVVMSSEEFLLEACVLMKGWGGECNVSFVSYMENIEDLKEGDYRLLEVDNRVVCPGLTDVRVHVTSYDVIHSWAVPSLGVKVDAVPGRLNSSSFKAFNYGVFYGQCSEMCGVKHSFMPICLEVVPYNWFSFWLSEFSN